MLGVAGGGECAGIAGASSGSYSTALLRNVAALYFPVSLDLSSTAKTFTPRLWASTSAFAIGADVKLYACIRMCYLAAVNSRTTASVAPPPGEKYMATQAGENVSAVCPDGLQH